LYWGLFLAGVSFVVLSLVFGGLMDASFDLDFSIGEVSLPIRPLFILVFITIFGGLGIVFTNILGQWLALAPATVGGILIAKPINHLFTVTLKRYETEAPSEKEAVGLTAVVIEKIAAGGTGRISFVLNGNILTGVAREKNKHGNGFSRNDSVKIVEISGNVYFVADNMEITSNVDLTKDTPEIDKLENRN